MKSVAILVLLAFLEAASSHQIFKRTSQSGNCTTWSQYKRQTSSMADLGLSNDAIIAKVTALYTSGKCPNNTISGCGSLKCDNETARTKVDSFYLSATITYNGSPYRLVIGNGIPNHCYQVERNKTTPNTACEKYKVMMVPLNPVSGTTYTENAMGAVGIATSGAFLYNHKSGEKTCNAAAITEAATMDPCNGHADPTCNYHYHSAPLCMTGWNGCTLLGYNIDGFGIYGECTLVFDDKTTKTMTSNYYLSSGTGCDTSEYTYDPSVAGGNLDKANGYYFTQSATSSDGTVTFSNNSYAYFFSSGYPFLNTGYYGTTAAQICDFTISDLS